MVLVGDRKLKKEIENRVKELKIQENVHFLGVRDDIPQILKTFDVFVFPSLYEGLGIAVIEAQVSGLYCMFLIHYLKKLILREMLILCH